MLMSFMSCSIIVAWHENRDPSSIASGEHSPNIYIYIYIYIYYVLIKLTVSPVLWIDQVHDLERGKVAL